MVCTVIKDFAFEAAHSLPHLPKGHKCRRTHGHTYRFSISVRGPVDKKMGWVIDYAKIGTIVRRRVVDVLDHQNINDFFGPTTNENLVLWMATRLKSVLPGLCAIECQEGDGGRVRLEIP